MVEESDIFTDGSRRFTVIICYCGGLGQAALLRMDEIHKVDTLSTKQRI